MKVCYNDGCCEREITDLDIDEVQQKLDGENNGTAFSDGI
jgi:hypothetical protein